MLTSVYERGRSCLIGFPAPVPECLRLAGAAGPHRARADVFDAPPLICIEILSRCDEVSDLLEKLAEYAAFGVPYIWVIDPRRQKAYTYSGKRLEEVAGALTTMNPDLAVPFDEIFRGL
jgi:Uma2 family endonuclease